MSHALYLIAALKLSWSSTETERVGKSQEQERSYALVPESHVSPAVVVGKRERAITFTPRKREKQWTRLFCSFHFARLGSSSIPWHRSFINPFLTPHRPFRFTYPTDPT